jgi:hypothetical protein
LTNGIYTLASYANGEVHTCAFAAGVIDFSLVMASPARMMRPSRELDMSLQRLRHIRWIGGGSGTGKSPWQASWLVPMTTVD